MGSQDEIPTGLADGVFHQQGRPPDHLLDGQRSNSQPGGWIARAIEHGSLTPKMEQIAEFIERNPQLAAFASASEIARHVEVNVATVVRLAQHLDYSGWVELQAELRHEYLRSLHLDESPRDQKQDPVALSLDRDIRNLRLALRTVDRNGCARIADLIASARRTLVIAGDSHAAAAQELSHLGATMGYDIRLEVRGGPYLALALSSLAPGDVLVVVSFWRSYEDRLRSVQLAKKRGIETVAITDSAIGHLANLVDHSVVVPTEGIESFQSVTAAVSVVYGILGHLREAGGARADESIARLQDTWAQLGTRTQD